MFVDFHILNELGSPSINSNTFANRPPAGQIGRLFVSTDTYEIYRDNGITWDLIGGPGSSTVTGTGAATQVAYWTASQAIGGSNNLWWDNTGGFLGVKTNSPTAGVTVVQTDGQGILSEFTTVAGTGNNAVAIYARNTTNSSGYVAVLEEKTPNSSAGQYPIKIMHSLSSGTAAANMATGIHFSLPDDAGTERINQFSMDTVDPAAATYTSRYRFVLRNAGAAATPFYVTAAGLGVYVASPSGLIHADGGASAARMILDADAGVARIFSFRSDNLPRWALRVDGAETGSNAGADFAIRAYNDAGAFTFAPLTIARSTGKSNWQATEAYSTGLARGNYFDYNLSVSAGGSFSSPNSISAVGASLDLTLAGNATIPSGARSGLDAYNTVNFTGSGTLTHSQGTQVRAYSNLTSGWAFAGSATGTITHLAGLRVLFPDNSGSAVSVTNNYGLLINDQTANTGTVTYTNRWGIYQEGASDLNYFAANTLIGTTTNSGEKLQVNGNAKVNGRIATTGGSLNDVLSQYVTIQDITNTNDYVLRYRNNGGSQIGYIGVISGSYFAYNNSNGHSFSSGNVSIGVTTFSYPLTIGTGGSASGVLRAGTSFVSIDSSYQSTGVYGTAGAPSLIFGGDDNTGFWHPAADTIAVSTNGAERMRITSAGNVIINNTNTAKGNLDVSADIGAVPLVIRGRSTDNAGQTEFWSYDGSTRFGVLGSTPSFSYFGSIANTYLYFLTNSSERARFTAGGNFLIGTTTDAGQKLQVNGTGLFSNFVTASYFKSLSGSQYTEYIYDGIYSTATDMYHNAQGNFSQRFLTNGSTRNIIKNTGQFRFVPLAADPAGAETGDVYYNSGTNKLRLYDGSNWVDLN